MWDYMFLQQMGIMSLKFCHTFDQPIKGLGVLHFYTAFILSCN